MGDAESRLKYRKALTEFFTQNSSELSETSRHRLERGHVFRILDSKETADERLISERACPVIDDYLTGDSRERFETTLEYLHSLGVAFNRNPRLVRGLDYYSHTVFEFIHSSSSLLGPSQSTVLAGGRYDGLVESLQDHRSNAVTPALGWAAGINRLAMLLANRNGQSDSRLPEVLIVFIPNTNTPQQDNTLLLNCGLVTAQKLRSCGVNAQYAGDLINNSKLPSSSKQLARLLKRSNRPQAAIFIGWEEVSNGNLTVKNLATGKQLTLPAKEAIEHIKGILY